MEPIKLATVWLGGCSGCHMSFLDMDEWLFELGQIADLVYSPLADIKQFPQGVDLALVEGAVANEENFELAKTIRKRSKFVVSFGDCAVTGNVTAMRNSHGTGESVVRTVYLVPPEGSQARLPSDREIVPALLDQVLPLHKVIPVDFFLPGCPPSAPLIRSVISQLVTHQPNDSPADRIRFG
jgi:NAD-reducing hydrogenase small subunit